MAHVVAVVDDQHVHHRRVLQPREQLRSQQEVLGAGLLVGGPDHHIHQQSYSILNVALSTHLARCPDQQLENPLLVGSVHPLVDLVHTTEGDGGQLLEGEHVQRCCHASLTPGL